MSGLSHVKSRLKVLLSIDLSDLFYIEVINIINLVSKLYKYNSPIIIDFILDDTFSSFKNFFSSCLLIILLLPKCKSCKLILKIFPKLMKKIIYKKFVHLECLFIHVSTFPLKQRNSNYIKVISISLMIVDRVIRT